MNETNLNELNDAKKAEDIKLEEEKVQKEYQERKNKIDKEYEEKRPSDNKTLITMLAIIVFALAVIPVLHSPTFQGFVKNLFVKPVVEEKPKDDTKIKDQEVEKNIDNVIVKSLTCVKKDDVMVETVVLKYNINGRRALIYKKKYKDARENDSKKNATYMRPGLQYLSHGPEKNLIVNYLLMQNESLTVVPTDLHVYINMEKDIDDIMEQKAFDCVWKRKK